MSLYQPLELFLNLIGFGWWIKRAHCIFMSQKLGRYEKENLRDYLFWKWYWLETSRERKLCERERERVEERRKGVFHPFPFIWWVLGVSLGVIVVVVVLITLTITTPTCSLLLFLSHKWSLHHLLPSLCLTLQPSLLPLYASLSLYSLSLYVFMYVYIFVSLLNFKAICSVSVFWFLSLLFHLGMPLI